MLSLTQSTLFFRDLALNTRVKDVPIGGHVLRWKAGVTAAKSPAPSAPDTTSSAQHRPPSTLSFTTGHPSSATSFSSHQELQVPSNIPEQDDLLDVFSDNVDDEDEHSHTVGNQTSGHGKKVVVVSGCCAPTILLTWSLGLLCTHRQ